MERADWLEGGFDPAQARFLMVTAITHHRFSSPDWGEHEIRRLRAELTGIDISTAQVLGSTCSPRLEPPPRRAIAAGETGIFLMTAAKWWRLPQIECSRGR